MELTAWLQAAARDPLAVAVDPATPAYVLACLAHEYPRETSTNRGWSLGLVSDPGWIDALLPHAEYFAPSEDLPAPWRGVRNLMREPASRAWLPPLLAKHANTFVNVFALLDPDLPPQDRTTIWEAIHAAWEEPRVRWALTQVGESIPPKNRSDESIDPPDVPRAFHVYFRLFSEFGWGSPALQEAWVERLASERYETLRLPVLTWNGLHERVAERALDLALHHSQRSISFRTNIGIPLLATLARAPATPTSVLERLVVLAESKRGTEATLIDAATRGAITTHPNLPQGVFERLTRHDPALRLRSHRTTEVEGRRLLPHVSPNDLPYLVKGGPTWLADAMVEAADPELLQAALLNPNRSRRIPTHTLSAEVRGKLAAEGEWPHDLELFLADDEVPDVRAQVALRTRHLATQQRFVKDASDDVRRNLALNPAIRLPVASHLLNDRDLTARAWIENHLLTNMLPAPN